MNNQNQQLIKPIPCKDIQEFIIISSADIFAPFSAPVFRDQVALATPDISCSN